MAELATAGIYGYFGGLILSLVNTYFIHDGRNEIGPFTIDLLKQQKLTRNTPIRQKNTNKWMPAEKLHDLKPLVAPRKIRRPKDIVPVVRERAEYYRRTKPVAFYSMLVLLPLITGVSIYTSTSGADAGTSLLPPVSQAKPSTPTPEVQPTASTTKTTTDATPAEAADPAQSSRQRWSKLITVSGSNYGIGFLGGIKDLSVTIRNRSEYVIDEAVAKVTYIKANGEVWKSKLVSVKNIAAHNSKDQAVEDVGRGKKVRITLQKVVSRSMNFSYTEGQRIGHATDPYYKG